MVKLVDNEIIPFLVDIFNLSIQEGKLPEDWKEAIVVPIYKGGERCKIQQYRPVSLTSCICKIMERVIQNRMKQIIDTNGGLNDAQHGFRTDYSCETQMLGFYTELTEVLDKGGRVDAIFLDFEKAFDKIDHAILMEKVWEKIGNLQITNWIGDFLYNRIQKVRVGEVLGEAIMVSSGVP
jgi:Reverse transcriptase (RNA-dependent DNA polymerase)